MRPNPTRRRIRLDPSKENEAFTLVELVVVIVVLGILGSVAVPRFVDFSGASKEAATKEGLVHLREQIQFLYLKSATSGGTPAFPSIGALRSHTSGKRPANPFSGASGKAKRILRMSSGTASSNIGSGGWAYDPVSGRLWANTYSGAKEHTW